MLLSDFDFLVPSEQIAQEPSTKRSDSRMLLQTKEGDLIDKKFTDLIELIEPGSVLIMNDSKVFSSRLFGQTLSGASCEVFLLQAPKEGEMAKAFALGKPMKKILKSGSIAFSDSLSASIIGLENYGHSSVMELQFNTSKTNLMNWLDAHAHLPLPPYIKRKACEDDQNRYQNVYADQTGSVAAPTAGLHFDEDTIKSLTQKGVLFAPITLHVGAGTFLPIKSEQIEDHVMHEETYMISDSSFKTIWEAKSEGRPILYVGTTAMRAMESFWLLAKKDPDCLPSLIEKWHQTNIFIHPSHTDELYRSFWSNGILTNFHQPKSSLFLLMCALFGKASMLSTYEHAIKSGYRFFSYGDCGLYWFKK